MNRQFPLGAALTVALGALGPPHSDYGPFCELRDLYELIGWLVGDIPSVEQLEGHTTQAQTALLAQHPNLGAVADVPPSGAPDSEVLSWLAAQETTLGAAVDITRGAV